MAGAKAQEKYDRGHKADQAAEDADGPDKVSGGALAAGDREDRDQQQANVDAGKKASHRAGDAGQESPDVGHIVRSPESLCVSMRRLQAGSKPDAFASAAFGN